MATIAVFGVLAGGTSYAATHITSGDIANNTIRSRDIKNNSILSKDIKDNSVRSKDVRDRSLLAKDFAPGQLPAGQTGPKGEKGDKGNDGTSTGAGGSGGSGQAGAGLLTGSGAYYTVGATVNCPPSGPGTRVCDTRFDRDQFGLSPATTIVARDLAIEVNTAPGSGKTATFTLVDDGADTLVSCVVSDAEKRCNSGTASTTIEPGSMLTLKIVTPAGTNYSEFSFGWRAVTQ